jgi:hypothetical protein
MHGNSAKQAHMLVKVSKASSFTIATIIRLPAAADFEQRWPSPCLLGRPIHHIVPRLELCRDEALKLVSKQSLTWLTCQSTIMHSRTCRRPCGSTL